MAARFRRRVKKMTRGWKSRPCIFNILRYVENGDKTADMQDMSPSAIGGIGSYLESVMGSVLNKVTGSGSQASSVKASTLQTQPDNTQLSPFAQLMSTLQQMQQSNPTEYQQVTHQIATNLQSAAQTATQDGNTSAASQLNQLSTDFTNASTSGQLPNIQDLAQAVGGGGGHHHHHHMPAASSDSDSSSTSSTSTASANASTSSSNPLSSLLAAFQSNSGSQSDQFNPMSIIMNTLSTAGITQTNS
jgi:hypothetical protein